MKRIISMLLVLLFVLATLPGREVFSGMAEAQRALTLMVYMCGSDLESGFGSASADLKEMLDSGYDDSQITILVMTGGTESWNMGFDSSQLSIIELGRRGLRTMWRGETRSMGDPQTLTTLLRFGAERYPAQNYALVLWDHGGGPMNGVCFDELYSANKTRDSLDLSELRTALTDSPFNSENPLEWIGFDACLMSSVETAFICAPFARYMIASQETEPGSGWDYSFLKHASESLGGDEMGKQIVEAYTGNAHVSDLMLTLSCIDLSQMQNVENAMNNLFGNLDYMLSPDHFSEISNRRRDAKSFGRASTGSEYDLVDLYSLAEQYAAVQADHAIELQTALEKAVVVHAGNQENSHGLSVYYPYYNKNYYQSPWRQQYSVWGFAEKYVGFMNHYADMWLGEQLADWSGVKATAQEPLPDSQEITLSLNPDQISDFAFAQVYIIGRLPGSNPYYYKIDEIDDVTLDDAGILHADYNYKALYVVDENDNPLCDAVPYRIVDGYFLIRANLADKTFETYWNEALSPRDLSINDDATIDVRKVFLMCLPNETGDGLNVVGIIDMREELGDGIQGLLADGESLFTGKQSISIDMEEWNWVWFFHFPREPQYDNDGNLLSFEDWSNPNVGGKLTVELEEIDNGKPWQLKFLEQQYSGRDLYAQYILCDTQGNLMGSDLIPVANPNLIHAMAFDETVYNSNSFTLTAKQLDLAKAKFNDGLFLHFDLTDHRKEPSEIAISLDNIVLNRCMLPGSYSLTPVLEQDSHTGYVLIIPTNDLPENLEETLDSIRFDVSISDTSSLNVLDEFSVALDTNADISPVHTSTQDQHILAEAKAGDITYQLTGIEETNDCITLSVIADNTSRKRVEKSWNDSAFINEYEWTSSVDTYFEIVEDSRKVEDVKVYKLSPPVGTIENLNDIPQYSYMEYWGVNSIDSFEFTDWNDEIISFKLEEPFLLKQTNSEAVNASESEETQSRKAEEEKERITHLLLKTDDIEVKLTGMYAQDSFLILDVDIANTSAGPIMVLSQYSAINGKPCDGHLSSLDKYFPQLLSEEEIPAGRKKRMAYTVKMEEIGDIVQSIDSVEMGFEYLPEEASIWQYCSPAILSFDGSTRVDEISNGHYGIDRVTVIKESDLMDNKPVDPLSIIDVTWDSPNEASEYQTNLCIPLTDTQKNDLANAKVMLMMPWSTPTENEDDESENVDLAFITSLSGAKISDGNKLVCPYNGLLIGAKGVDMPVAHSNKRTNVAYSFDVPGIRFYTDHSDLMESGTWFEELTVSFNPDKQSAIIENASLSRSIGCSESITTLGCGTVLYTYTNGIGSPLEETSIFVGKSCELNDGCIHLVIRPAEDYNPIVVFVIQNKDGSEYTIQATYQEAIREAGSPAGEK